MRLGFDMKEGIFVGFGKLGVILIGYDWLRFWWVIGMIDYLLSRFIVLVGVIIKVIDEWLCF